MAKTLIQQSRAKTPAEKAAFHAISGAGKSKVIRDFFALSERDEQFIEAELGTAIDVNLHRQG
jgi:hypothetical protein